MCCGGTTKRQKPETREQSLGFSGKLKSKRSFGKPNEDSYSYPDVGVFEKTPQLYDSGELRFSISCELKPSTPARTGPNKVHSPLFMHLHCNENVNFVHSVSSLCYALIGGKGGEKNVERKFGSQWLCLFLFCFFLLKIMDSSLK